MSLLISNLKKIYVGPDGSRVPVIDIESLQIATGEQAALIGTSGSGKTTLLHLIAGILVPDSGQILFDGEPQSSSADVVPYRGPTKGVDIAQLSEGAAGRFSRPKHRLHFFKPIICFPDSPHWKMCCLA